jgi:hypothetical protein
MESYKLERLEQYDTYILQNKLKLSVIGTTMNKLFKHKHKAVDSVPYKSVVTLLKDYNYCIILHDNPHDSYNLPLKVSECLQAGIVPILDIGFGTDHPFPTCSNIDDVIEIVNSKDNKICHLIKYYKNSINLWDLKYTTQLVETDSMFLGKIENILRWGRNKHKGHYWRDNLDVKDFISAAYRHLNSYNKGDILDDETHESHLIHCACNLMFQQRIDNGL